MNTNDNRVLIGFENNSPSKPSTETVVDALTGGKANWVAWKEAENNGRKTKIPYTVDGSRASVTNLDDWVTYETVAQVADRFTGIGFILDGSILGVDLDKCLHQGVITDPLIKTFIEVCDTYVEVSPSGTGLHTLFRLSEPVTLVRNRHENYEVYNKDRYFTFTGEQLNESPVRTINSSEVEVLLAILGYPWGTPEPIERQEELDHITLDTDLTTIKEKMFASKNGKNLERLYNGDTSSYGGDTSQADAALCKHLVYWTNGNPGATKALWLDSGLAQRDKTQLREDYVERTLNFALLNSSNGVEIPEITTTGPGSSSSETHRNVSTSPRAIFAEKEIDLEDLLKMNITTEWDIEQLVTKGSLNMIASAPHQGKTFMALHIAICVANGIPVFGRFEVKETKNVLIVNEEDTLADIKGRLESMVPSERNQKHIKVYSNTGMKVSDEWVDGLLERAKEHGAGLIILDSLAALSLANENEAQAMQPVMDNFRRIVNAGITVIFIHHDRKGGQSPDSNGGSAMDKARGSSAITAAVHGYLSIKELPGKQFQVSQVKLKANVAKVKPFVIQMHQNVTQDQKFHYDFEYIGEYNSEATAQDGIEERISRLCRKHDDFIFTRKTLVENGIATSPDDKTLRKSLKWMESNGLLESCKYGDLSKGKQSLVWDSVQRANALVYLPTEKLLAEESESIEEDASEEIEQIKF